VVEASERRPDPGDRALLESAATERRILVTIDTDFGELLFVERRAHAGLVRLPDVPAARRMALMRQVLDARAAELQRGAVLTVRGGRMRIASLPSTGEAPE
jgi:predicted nuclease of predicted toxin-antitoxin system